MEKGSLRCDANISIRPYGVAQLGTKVEIKNLNSIKMVQRALEYEQARQIATLAGLGTIRQETRLWNDEAQETSPLRKQGVGAGLPLLPRPGPAAARARHPS
jgi:aspartyl-tRNA(Asn)/glutamyl-tRNA(Gln) amidotransferase subunit B